MAGDRRARGWHGAELGEGRRAIAESQQRLGAVVVGFGEIRRVAEGDHAPERVGGVRNTVGHHFARAEEEERGRRVHPGRERAGQARRRVAIATVLVCRHRGGESRVGQPHGAADRHAEVQRRLAQRPEGPRPGVAASEHDHCRETGREREPQSEGPHARAPCPRRPRCQLGAHGHGEADLVLATRAGDDVRFEVGAPVGVRERVGHVPLDERPRVDYRAGQRCGHGVDSPSASSVGAAASA